MKDKILISLYVTSCNELHNEGKVYDGIYSVVEALEIFENFSEDDKPSLGINIHKWGSKALSDTKIDIVIGKKIYMESFEYLPKIMQCEEVYIVVAEVLAYLPEFSISGSVPDKVVELKEKYSIAHKMKEDEKRQILIKKLEDLAAEALKYSGSKNVYDRKYAEDLLNYTREQKDLIDKGATVIDIPKLPLKENYINVHTKETVEAYQRGGNIKDKNPYKEKSLMGRLYQYKELLRNGEAD